MLISMMMTVGWSGKGKPLQLRHIGSCRAHFQDTAQTLIFLRLPGENTQTCGDDQVWKIGQEDFCAAEGTSHIWQLGDEQVRCGGAGEEKHSGALFCNSSLDVGTVVHDEYIVCFSDEDGRSHVDVVRKLEDIPNDMETI